MLERHAVQEDLYSNYAQWVARYDSIDESWRSAIRARIAALPRSPRFSLLLFVGSNEHERIRATIQSVLAQLYENWELMLAGTTSCSAATFRGGSMAIQKRIRTPELLVRGRLIFEQR